MSNKNEQPAISLKEELFLGQAYWLIPFAATGALLIFKGLKPEPSLTCIVLVASMMVGVSVTLAWGVIRDPHGKQIFK